MVHRMYRVQFAKTTFHIKYLYRYVPSTQRSLHSFCNSHFDLKTFKLLHIYTCHKGHTTWEQVSEIPIKNEDVQGMTISYEPVVSYFGLLCCIVHIMTDSK